MRPKKLVVGIVALVTAVSTAFALNLPAPFFTLQVLAQTANERKAVAERLFRQARQEFNNNKFEAALQFWQQALKIYREIKNRQSEGAVLGNLGLAYNNLGDHTKAIEYYQQSLIIVRQIKNRQSEGAVLSNLGLAYNNLGDYTKAIEYYQQSLIIVRQIKNRQSEGAVLGNLGLAYNNLGDYTKAIEYYQQSLAIAQEFKDRRSKENALNNLGIAFRSLGDYAKAIEYHQQALKIAREFKDRRSEGNALGNLGIAYDSLGDYAKAIEYHQQDLKIARQIKNSQGESAALGNLGTTYDNLGDYAKAIDYHQQALAIARQIKDLQSEGKTLGNLGNAYGNLGDYTKAIEYHQQALTIARQIKDPQSKGKTLGNLGNAYRNLGDYTKAIEYYQQVLTIARQIKDPQSEGKTLGNLGNAYADMGDDDQAIEYYQQVLTIAHQIKDSQMEGTTLGNLGLSHSKLGDYAKAIEYQQKSLTVARQIKDRESEGSALNNLGLALQKAGKLSEAEKNLFKAIEVRESIREKLGSNDTFKVSIFERQANSYRNLQSVLIARKKTDKALEIAERGRARAFVELLQRRAELNLKAEYITPPPTIELLKQTAKQQNATLVQYSIIVDDFKIDNKLKSKESDLYIWVIKPTGEVNFRQVDLKPLLQKQNISLKDLVRNNLESLGVAKGTTRSVRDKQTFAVGDFIRLNNDFSTDPAWEVVAVNLQNSTLKLRNTTWDKGTQPITRPFTDATKVSSPFSANIHSQQLHQLLIDPIADVLPKDLGDRIIFIPQGSLFFVPFPALQDVDRKYLIQKHTILTAPSIQVLSLTRQKRQQISGTSRDVLVVGNPTMPKVSSYPGEPAQQLNPLPNSELEAKDVARMYKTNAIVGNKATKSAILPLLPKARIIHLATHGLLDDFTGGGIPGAVALAPEPLNQGKDERANGLLTASEIFDLKLNNTELVVLSACNTGVGRITGDGVIGLSRSLISAGVPSVIVSLWSIPDAPTASLMTEFYQRLQQGNDKASALRQAMLKTMEKHPDPKNWAAFTLIGSSD